MPHPEVKVIRGKKTFIPLENNPEVMRQLADNLGVSSDLEFYDVLDVDDKELLAFVPRPVHALIFLCHEDVYHATRDEVEEQMKAYQGFGSEEPVMWFKQTIGHACGLMAFLHSIFNGAGRGFILPESELNKLLQASIPLPPQLRADLLYQSEFLELAHMSAATVGDSVAPSPEDPCGFHFISFVKANDGHLWELNGGMPGPLDHGILDPDEDALSPKALDLTVKKFIARKGADIRYSIVALSSA
ncbi:ubiquitin C-terminal hydrolase [Talaromyces proteolyticus]|uniref:Ubiquitin carboxyl-terminal hydrolase n=1 Tax=Talaromyces proteolyticus TaxID=1131652 RepID=A0AAD4L675_9EURO|nr:ubiquitin C-terminal hydrolase [Talaromyces proteolyticus]KAH8705856.1 ubiquitin C-terminal hydrolase [Talaromyces proteolyticus]